MEQSVKCCLGEGADAGSVLTREDFFFNNALNFHMAYTLPGLINFNFQRGKPYTWLGSTWNSKINYNI